MPAHMIWFIVTSLLIVALLTTGVVLAAGLFEREQDESEHRPTGEHRAGPETETARSESTSGQEQHAA